MHAPAFKGFRWRKCSANSKRARPSSLTYVTSVNAGAMALFLDRSMSRVVCSSSGLIPSRSITRGIWTRRSVLLYTARVVCVLPWRQMCCRNWGTRMWLTWRWGTTRGKKPVAPGRKCLFPASCARDKERQLHLLHIEEIYGILLQYVSIKIDSVEQYVKKKTVHQYPHNLHRIAVFVRRYPEQPRVESDTSGS